MAQLLTPRNRKVRILATLGPASNTPEMIRRLYLAGADAFRINMSHGGHEDKIALIQAIRGLERDLGRPTTILFDLQGPKLRVGRFAELEIQAPEEQLDAARTVLLQTAAELGLSASERRSYLELLLAARGGGQS